MSDQVGWDDMRGFLSLGGTLIGTARSATFRTLEGRRRAVLNLVKHNIEALVVCGGDGSLTGADRLRAEWGEHITTLLQNRTLSFYSSLYDIISRETDPNESVRLEEITQEQFDKNQRLNIVGLVGSIDNDMAGTDMTIGQLDGTMSSILVLIPSLLVTGATTALHRICEAVDSISSTASSHSRAFVIEVMGRNCGWLALMAAISTGADYMFIPERPPTAIDWQSSMCGVLERVRRFYCLISQRALTNELVRAASQRRQAEDDHHCC